ncbi:MAG: TetR/AcrR family transcriptional regulator [Mycobacterium sp.]
MIEPINGKADRTRQHILRAASRPFAVMPYTQVNLFDILTSANVTKGVLYTHFGSKLQLATALVERHLDVSRKVGGRGVGLGLSGLEALIDYCYVIAAADISHYLTRASLNLFESVGRFDGLQDRVSKNWIHTFADIATRGINEGDIRPECNPEHVAHAVAAIYLGTRQTSDLDDPQQFIGDFEAMLLLALPGFTNPNRIPYFTGFIKRRSAFAIDNAAPLGADKL